MTSRFDRPITLCEAGAMSLGLAEYIQALQADLAAHIERADTAEAERDALRLRKNQAEHRCLEGTPTKGASE